MNVDRVTINHKENPLGVDSLTPKISWVVKSDTIGDVQTAYEIIVATSQRNINNNIGDFYCSGRVVSSKSLNVDIEGAIRSRTRYYVKVRVWNFKEVATPFSEVFFFETGNFGNFSGEWITDNRPPIKMESDLYKLRPAPIFTKSFTVIKEVRSARLYIAGLGFYEARINSHNVTDSVLNPAITNYSKVVLYNTYSVSRRLVLGKNTLEVELGNGMYNPLPIKVFGKYNLRDKYITGTPKLILDLEIKYTDGSSDYIKTDTTWQWYMGSLLSNNLYIGEVYDSSIDDSTTLQEYFEVLPVRHSDVGKLSASEIEPIEITRVIDVPSSRIRKIAPGQYIIDYGQNFNGLIDITLKDQKGIEVELTYAEALRDDGFLDYSSTVVGSIDGNGGDGSPKSPIQKDVIVCSGEEVTYRQKFTFHSGRYVGVCGSSSLIILRVQGLRINTAMEEIGHVKTSNSFLSELYDVSTWTKLSSVYSVQADTPRERFGYGGDIVCTSDSLSYQFNTYNFYKKIVTDFSLEQDQNGGITETAPYMGIRTGGLGGTSGPLGWQFVYPYLQKKLLQYFGDIDTIVQEYPRLKRQIDFLLGIDYDYIQTRGLGDWCSIAAAGKDPKSIREKGFVEMIFYYLHLKYFIGFAKLLSKTDDYNKYSEITKDVYDYIIKKFKNIDGSFASGDQTSYAFAIYAGLASDYQEKDTTHLTQIAQSFVRQIVDKDKGHLTGGIFGTKMTYVVMNKISQNRVIYDYLNKISYPSFGFMLNNGATTIWERMEKTEAEGHGVESQNHSMFTSYTAWYYEGLGGITPNDDAIGFSHVSIVPFIVDDLDYVECSIDTVRGVVGSRWERVSEGVDLVVDIPVGVVATLTIPEGYNCPGNKAIKALLSGRQSIHLAKEP